MRLIIFFHLERPNQKTRTKNKPRPNSAPATYQINRQAEGRGHWQWAHCLEQRRLSRHNLSSSGCGECPGDQAVCQALSSRLPGVFAGQFPERRRAGRGGMKRRRRKPRNTRNTRRQKGRGQSRVSRYASAWARRHLQAPGVRPALLALWMASETARAGACERWGGGSLESGANSAHSHAADVSTGAGPGAVD